MTRQERIELIENVFKLAGSVLARDCETLPESFDEVIKEKYKYESNGRPEPEFNDYGEFIARQTIKKVYFSNPKFKHGTMREFLDYLNENYSNYYRFEYNDLSNAGFKVSEGDFKPSIKRSNKSKANKTTNITIN